MTDEEMLAAAADVGFSETAFLFPSAPTGELTEGVVTEARVRYLSPLGEVPFCGHATMQPPSPTPSATALAASTS